MKDLFKVNSFEELMETAKKDSETKNLLHKWLREMDENKKDYTPSYLNQRTFAVKE